MVQAPHCPHKRDAVVIEKKIRFEFVQVGSFEPPASDRPQQGAQHGVFEPPAGGKTMSHRLLSFPLNATPNTRPVAR